MPEHERSFDRLAINFDRFAELAGGPLNTYIESVLPDRGGRAVDLGCGTGRHAAMLASRFRRVLAVDISAPMLQLAQARRGLPNITYQLRDLCSVDPDIDGTFDLILSAYALHHVADLAQTLQGIRALCAPGGRVVLIDNVADTPAVPRQWFITQAIYTLAGDVLRRRRPLAEAAELYRLGTDPAWLNHLTTDRFLSPDQFAHHYGQVFPGVRFDDLYRARSMRWDLPPERA
jgi:SAM-dependent methyltransferase